MQTKLLYVSNFNDDSIGAYVIVEAFLNQLTVSIALEGKELQFEVTHREFYQSAIVCVDASLSKTHVNNSLVNILVGLDDGTVLQILISMAQLASPPLHALCVNQFSSSITFARIFKGFVVCGTKEGELSIFYERDNSFIRVNVLLESCLLSEELGSYLTTTSVASCCEIFDTDMSFSTNTNIYDSKQRYWHFLNHYCDNIAANVILQPLDYSAESMLPAEQCVLLLGCTDGSAWWITTPERSSFLSMASCLEGGAGSVLAVRGSLLDTFTGPIERLVLSPLSLEEILGEVLIEDKKCGVEEGSSVGRGNQGPCAATLWVLAADWHGTVLGLERQATDYASSVLLRPRQLDFELFSAAQDFRVKNLSFIDGLFLYTDPKTGALWSRNLVKQSKGTSLHVGVVKVRLSPLQCPVVRSCQILASAAGTEASSLGQLLLTTDVGVVVLQYEVACLSQSLSLTQRVMAGLQRALSGRWHAQAMVPICRTEERASSSTAARLSRTISSNRTATTRDELLVRLKILGGEFLQTQGTSIEAVERELQLDCGMLGVMALLAELGDMRYGMRLLPCFAGSTSLWEWSAPHCNQSRAVSLQFKLRREPSGSGDSASWVQGSSLFLDLRLRTQSLTVMRALQGRTMLVSLDSVALSSGSSPLSSATAFSVSITWQLEAIEDLRSAEKSFTFSCTVPLTSIDRLSDYSLCISVVAEDETGGGSTAALIHLMEELLSLYAMAPVVLCSDEYSNSIRFRDLQKSLASGSGATTRSLDLVLPETRFSQGMSIALRWQRMVHKVHDAVLHRETQQQLLRSNPLRAAFFNSDMFFGECNVRPTAAGDPVHLNISSACAPDPGTEASRRMKAKHSSGDTTQLSLESNACSILIHIAAELRGLGMLEGDNVCAGENSSGGLLPATCHQTMAMLAHIARQHRGPAADEDQNQQRSTDHARALNEVWRCYQLLREKCCV